MALRSGSRRALASCSVALAPLLLRRPSANSEAVSFAVGDPWATLQLGVLARQVAQAKPTQQQAATAGGAAAVPQLSFGDYQAIFKGQPTSSLLRGLLVFTACAIPGFVEAAPTLLRLSRQYLGERFTMAVIRHSFFQQFCGGEDEASLQGKVRELRQRGIGSILDYAAEDDVPLPAGAIPAAPTPITTQSPSTTTATVVTPTSPTTVTTAHTLPAPSSASTSAAEPSGAASTESAAAPPAEAIAVVAAPPGTAVARQYCYLSEAKCDGHVETFLSSIASAGRAPGQGFAAVKLTALGNPLLLKRVSTAVREVQALFAQWDADGNQVVDRKEFTEAYSLMLPDATAEEQRRVFEWLDQQKGDRIDYVAWCQRLSLTKMPELAARIAASNVTPGSAAAGVWRASLQSAALDAEEVRLVSAMRQRLRRLAAAASQAQVKVMVDAEHTYFQPAIDHLTLELSRAHNRGDAGAVIFNTYQAYLTDTPARLKVDLERARREGYVLGAKLVRGAYMEIERARAESKGYPSPICATIADTHKQYDECAQILLQAVKQKRAEVLFGTHNQASIEGIVRQMAELGLDPVKSPVFFGQLLGMSDHLTQVLGTNGFHAYKYVPYGAIELVVPYLLRRAVENASIMKGSKRDVALLQAELWRRARAAVGLK